MPRTALTQAEVFDTAAAILRTLKSLGYDACFVGSVACSLYGMVRTPNVRFPLSSIPMLDTDS